MTPHGADLHAMPQIMQLNQAGRHVVSQRPRWHLLDYGMISEATAVDGAHLRDGLHPNSAFVIQGLNIMLNLYREHITDFKLKASSG